MRFTVHKSSRIAAAGFARPTIEKAVEHALMLMRTGGSVRIEDHETGATYRDEQIEELRKMLDA